MSRTFHIAVATAIGGLALALAATASAAPAPKTMHGKVGPGFTIDLTLGGSRVTTLKADVPYRLLINDGSASHDFHLSGPGLNRVLTGIEFTGTRSLILTLKKGTYRFFCDPHASSMHGSFRVV